MGETKVLCCDWHRRWSANGIRTWDRG